MILCPTSIFAATKKITAKCIGERITITSDKKGTTYQWQEKSKNKNWKNMKKQKSRKLVMQVTWKQNQNKYRCVVTNKKGKKSYSKTTTLKIEKNPVITKQPENQYTRKSGYVRFETDAYGGNELTYTWEKRKNNNTKWTKTGTGKVLGYIASSGSMMFRCKIYNKITKGTTYTNIVQLFITDENTKYYSSEIPNKLIRGLLRPKAVDKHVYIASYDTKFTKEIKDACNTINKEIKKNTFIYTDSQHIADIIITDYDSSIKNAYKSIFVDSDMVDYLKDAKGDSAAGLAWSDDNYGVHFLISLNRKMVSNYTSAEVNCVIIHEIGHCIGIGHSTDKYSVMYPNIISVKMTKTDINKFSTQVKKIEDLQTNIPKYEQTKKTK